jgi:quinol monooxygenase YgiN
MQIVEIWQFDVLPEHREAFVQQIFTEFGTTMARESPGSHQSLVEDEDTPNRFFFLVVFADQTARDAHHAGPTLARAVERMMPMLASKFVKLGAGPRLNVISSQPPE